MKTSLAAMTGGCMLALVTVSAQTRNPLGGGTFSPSADYNITGSWDFSTAPTVNGASIFSSSANYSMTGTWNFAIPPTVNSVAIPLTSSASTFTRQQTYRAAHSDASSIQFTGLNSAADVANNSMEWRTELTMPYGLGTYITSSGLFATGKYMIISNKRMSAAGVIQGVSATADGAEATMLGISPDVPGPALGIEAPGTPPATSFKNQSAIGFYDLDTYIGGATSNGSGYHAKKAQITGNGSFWWGANLGIDPPANYEANLVPTFPSATQKGLTLTANAASTVLNLYEITSTASLRNWQIATNSVANGSFDLLVGASQGAAPSVTALSIDSSGNALAKSFRGTAVAFASLPTPVEGMLVGVTDSNTATWGATVAAGGANHVLAYYNGTNWTVAGK